MFRYKIADKIPACFFPDFANNLRLRNTGGAAFSQLRYSDFDVTDAAV